MSRANYALCAGCDRKALYVGEEDVPEGVEVWHSACRREAAPAPSLAGHARQLVGSYDQMRPALPFRSEWVRMAAEVLREVARNG